MIVIVTILGTTDQKNLIQEHISLSCILLNSTELISGYSVSRDSSLLGIAQMLL